MTAYAIFIRKATTDAAEFATYVEMSGPARQGHAMTILARYGTFEVLEGHPAEGAVLIAFPSFAEAKE